MFDFISPLIAAVESVSKAEEADSAHELVNYEFARLTLLDDSRWLLAGLALGILVIVTLAIGIYIRESRNLPRFVAGLLATLRLLAIGGAVLFFLNLQKRTDKLIENQSRVAILVDTSQSMSVSDVPALVTGDLMSRSEAVLTMLQETGWIDALRQAHDVSLAVFDRDLRRIAEWDRQQAEDQSESENHSNSDSVDTNPWASRLTPLGAETRLGDAISKTIAGRPTEPLAGIVILSDGGQNSGLDPLAISEVAQQHDVPLFTVGVGSSQPRRNLWVKQLIAPSRVYPDDRTTIRALVQAEGYQGRSVDVELYLRTIDEISGTSGKAGIQDRVGRERVTFDLDGEVLPVEFEIEPVETGRLELEVRLVAPADDQNSGDNFRKTEVEVVETASNVLLLASAATRDYRFLRNQLRRDRHTKVDVCLQMAPAGISQDADHILAEFPSTKEQLYPYDCIVAFDPDWTLLDVVQVDLLEKWVAEEAGGLIVVAGPIHMASWIQSPEHAKIRDLYPVEFQRRLTLLDDGQYGAETPWPIDFSRAGLDADYLWLGDTGEISRSLWERFTGVYGCYAVKGAKPGARVLGSFSDPEAGISTEPPVYLAEQFYGAGRVFYMGSGELWRLRRMDPGYFEVLYTQLIRHVSQGRLLRGSSHGSLLVEQDRYTIGDTIVVRAQLSSASREPLVADRVTSHVVAPSGTGRSLILQADAGRVGNFVGQFTVLEQGTYRIELPIPGTLEEQLTRRFEVTVPNLEYEETERNESLLAALATQTGGRYYTNTAAAVDGTGDLPSIDQIIESRAEVDTIRGAPDEEFTNWLNHLLLAVICGCLCLEWFLRRLLKLA